ncbi:MAG TPA: 50S ribosomal protein L30 [Bacteroidetes bacterium]|nr:50S ribosomal protein L30 [bacterium BMS3Bbin04]HDO64927.1 50S ribosomal protein L30 [Bacteroidota bacterium]HEX04052.1 50S ribosomal protein L30 [Bacteroidota bacterium]
MAEKRLRITWTRSAIGRQVKQKRIIEALGLHKLNNTVEHDASPTILGMIAKVPHLVDVEEFQVEVDRDDEA